MDFIFNDGGRVLAGYKGTAGDCVTRAIAIGTGIPYKEVYDSLHKIQKEYAKTKRDKVAKSIKSTGASPRNGVHSEIAQIFLERKGWIKISQKEKLDSKVFKKGTFICSVRSHFTTLIDGVLHDTYDCSMTKGGIYDGKMVEPTVRTAFHYYVKG